MDGTWDDVSRMMTQTGRKAVAGTSNPSRPDTSDVRSRYIFNDRPVKWSGES